MAASEAAVTAVDPDFCSHPGRVGVPWHSWRFDGDDDSHIICQFCGEMRDSLSGRVIRPAAEAITAADRPSDRLLSAQIGRSVQAIQVKRAKMRADRIEGKP